MVVGDEVGSDTLTASKQVLRISFTRLMQRAAELREQRAGGPLAMASPARDAPVVPIRAAGGSGRPPLFLLHPVGGSASAYFRLARSLHSDQPVYAIENQAAFNPRARSFDSIEAMASAYLQFVDGTGADPPYVLGGYSMGGMVAFEMARQLTALGKPVALVAIIDTPAAVAPVEASVDGEGLTAQDVVTMATVISGPLGVDLGLDVQELEATTAGRRMDYLIAALRVRRILPPEIDAGLFHKLVAVIKANDLAQRRYRPGCYAGKVALFRAAERFQVLAEEAGRLYEEPSFGWQQLCAQPVHVTTLPGSHLQLLKMPYVAELGASLQSAIDSTIPAGSIGLAVRAATGEDAP
jgi:thioesterase domain-containing protein